MKIIINNLFRLVIIGVAMITFSCEDELPAVEKVNDNSPYVGDWNGVAGYVFKNNGEDIDTLALEETLRLESSGDYQIIDLMDEVLEDGFFTLTEFSHEEYDTGTATLLQLIDIQEDVEDNFEDINGENVFYSSSSFNVIEVSSTKLVLSDARQNGRDFVTYTYSR